MSVADQGSPAPILRRLPFTIRLAPQLVNQLIKQCDHPTATDQINGLLFGLIEDGVVIAQAHRRFDEKAEAGGSASRTSQDNLFEQHLLASQKQAETKLLNLIGWYAVRLEGGLSASDLIYHDWYFPRPHDLALIVKPEPPLGLTLELYCRTWNGQLNEEGHRVGIVRLSNSPVESAIEVIPRPRIQDEFFMRAYDLTDTDEDKSPGWLAIRYRKVFAFLRANDGEAPSKSIPQPSSERDPIRELAREPLQEKPKPAAPAPHVNPTKSTPPDRVTIAPQTALQTTAPALPPSPPAPAPVLIPRPTTQAPALTNVPLNAVEAVRPRRPWMTALLVFVLTSFLTFGFIYYLQVSDRLPEFLRVLAPRSNLGLKVEAQSDRLLISWNRQNVLVRRARDGSLSIDDGGQKRQVLLDASHVKDGSVLYHPNSADLTFRLEVHGADGQASVESIQLLEASRPEALDLPKTSFVPPSSANPKDLTAKPNAYRPPPDLYKSLPEPAEPEAKMQSGTTPISPEVKELTNTGAEVLRANAGKTSEEKFPPIPEIAAVGQRSTPEQFVATPPEPFRQIAPPRTEAPAIANPAASAPANSVTYQPPRPTRQVLPNISSLPPGVLMQAGQLEVLVRVDKSGKVVEAAAASDGRRINQVLVGSAIAAARQWKFEPATLRGKAVPSRHSIIFQFSGRH